MFNFSHTEEELRDIIQALEAKIFGHQQHIKKLVEQAQAQAPAPAAPVAEAPAPVAPAVQPVADTASVQQAPIVGANPDAPPPAP
jgi:hypothetical protein